MLPQSADDQSFLIACLLRTNFFPPIRVQVKFPKDISAGVSGEFEFSFFLSHNPTVEKISGNCYTFNMDGAARQEAPGQPGGMLLQIKRFKQDSNECYQLIGKTDLCAMTELMFHPPGTAPPFMSVIMDQHISLELPFEVENRINLPKPHGDCISEQPQLLASAFPQLKKFQYTKDTCYKAKFAPREIPLAPVKGFTRDMLRDLDCFDECDQRLYPKKTGNQITEDMVSILVFYLCGKHF